MDSLKGGTGSALSRASRATQVFEVFRDAPPADSLPGNGGSMAGEASGARTELGSLPPHSAVASKPLKQSKLVGIRDTTNDGAANPVKRHAKFSPQSLPPTSPDTTRGGVLTKNSLKVNLSPREVPEKHAHVVVGTKPSARQKRSLPQEDHDNDQYPRKSLKSGKATLESIKDLPDEAKSREGAVMVDDVMKELSVYDPLVAIPRLLEEINNSSTAHERLSTVTSPEPIVEITTDPAGEAIENAFAVFNGGDPTTPRSPAMYNFNSTMRMLNPFKAVGNLFGRLSATHSPSKPQHQNLSSDEIAKQVNHHLQHFEDRMFDRLVAYQTANQSGGIDVSGIRQPTTEAAMLSSPVGLTGGALEPQDLNELVMSPLQKFDKYVSPDAKSSPLPPMSQFRKIALHPADLQLLEESQQTTFRSSVAALLKSPTVGKSKQEAASRKTSDRRTSFTLSNLFSSPAAKANADNTQTLELIAGTQKRRNEDHDIDVLMQDGKDAMAGLGSSPIRGTGNAGITGTDTNHEQHRLRNKASQHLKKMASRMNLRSKKSTTNDETSVDNDNYRTMKKKNKNELLKDYLALQQEKQELERQLAVKAEHAKEDVITVQNESPKAASPSKQVQDGKTADLLPILLESKIPDLRVGRKRSKSPDSQGVEHGRAKRRSLGAQPAGLSVSSPLSSPSNENAANSRPPLSDHTDTAPQQLYNEESSKKNDSSVEEKAGDAQASLTAGKVPPVPAVPSQYRSKVPQPANTRRSSRKRKAIEENWDGWDAEVF